MVELVGGLRLYSVGNDRLTDVRRVSTGMTPMLSLRATLWLVNVLLVGSVATAVGWSGAGWLEGYLVTNTPPPPDVRTKRTNDTPKRRLPLSEFQAILDVNAFRAERSELGAALTLPTGARPTVSAPSSLNLKLTGTFVAGTGSFAMVIGGAGSTEQLYQRGECIPRGPGEEPSTKDCKPNQGLLRDVRGDHIVVRFNAQDTVVQIQTDELPPEVAAPQAPAATGPTPAEPEPAPAVAGSTAPFPSQREGSNVLVQVPSAEVEKAFENFTDIIKQARVVPFSRDGQVAGFQIRKIVGGSIFHRLGLQNFDVIESVNGESLTNADQALRLFTLFKNETEINLNVRRRNEELRFNYRVQ